MPSLRTTGMSAMASTTPSTAMDRNLLDYRASQSWEDLMYEEQRGKKPWRKVSLALFLCLAGASMLIAGICLWYKGPGQGSGMSKVHPIGVMRSPQRPGTYKLHHSKQLEQRSSPLPVCAQRFTSNERHHLRLPLSPD